MSVDESTLAASRRAVLAGAGAAAVALVAGCATYDSSGGSAAPPAGGGANGGAASSALAKAADVPVGGGLVTAAGVVVTQPTAGQFRGFTAICTHQGCTVSTVQNGLITCLCHGSAFKVADGTVAQGPATKELKKIEVKQDGADIVLA
jgi:Rieske Fe-S protein